LAGASQIYHEAIKALANAAVGSGTLADPSGRAFLDNPLCGDCVEMQVSLASQEITALAHEVRGCLLCRASASLIGKHALGATLADIERIAAEVSLLLKEGTQPKSGWEELAVFQPVHGHVSRYRCVELPFQALIEAMRAPADTYSSG
jgi:nitrogen fixation protein NifU and related proteins